MRVRLAVVSFLIATAAVAQRGMYRPGTGNPDVQLVPWKFLDKSEPAVKGPFVVYWLPSTVKDIERSPLFSSSALLEDAVRCIQFEIVSPGAARFSIKPPAALIMNGDRIVRQVSAARPKAVEQMVGAEIDAREEAVLKDLQQKNIDVYKRIWDQRCLYPLIGLEAQRRLKELGVIVQEPPSTLMPDPNLKPIKKP